MTFDTSFNPMKGYFLMDKCLRFAAVLSELQKTEKVRLLCEKFKATWIDAPSMRDGSATTLSGLSECKESGGTIVFI